MHNRLQGRKEGLHRNIALYVLFLAGGGIIAIAPALEEVAIFSPDCYFRAAAVVGNIGLYGRPRSKHSAFLYLVGDGEGGGLEQGFGSYGRLYVGVYARIVCPSIAPLGEYEAGFCHGLYPFAVGTLSHPLGRMAH